MLYSYVIYNIMQYGYKLCVLLRRMWARYPEGAHALRGTFRDFLVVHRVKNTYAMQETQETQVQFPRSPGEGYGNPLQISCLENPMDRGAWWPTVHWVAKSQTWLSDKHTHTHIALRAVSGVSCGWCMHTTLWVCVLSEIATSWLIHSFCSAGWGLKVCTRSSKMEILPHYDVSSNHLFPLLLKTTLDFREQQPFPPFYNDFFTPQIK